MSRNSSSTSTPIISLSSLTYHPPPSLSSVQPATATDTSSNSSSHNHAVTRAAIGGSVGALCAITIAFLLALLYWRRRKRRVLREQQIAIRRMTIIGPPSSTSPPSLPSPVPRGIEPGFFSNMGDIEMSTGKTFGASGNKEAILPWTKIPAPAHQRYRNRVNRDRESSVDATAGGDSSSIYTSKQSEAGEGDRMVLVDGVYVLALERDGDHSDGEREAKTARPERRT